MLGYEEDKKMKSPLWSSSALTLVVVAVVVLGMGQWPGVWCRSTQMTRSQGGGGSLVLIGGHLQDDNAEVYNTIVNLAGGRGQARIGIVTAANTDPDGSYRYYSDIFLNRYGAASTLHVNVSIWNSSAASDPQLVSRVRTMTGFFLGGGEQARVVQSMYLSGHLSSPVLSAIRDGFKAGAVVSGTSAGSSCMPASVMIMTGSSWNALTYGAQQSPSHPDDLTYNPQGGLAFLHGYVIDSHFATRGREGRMIRLLSDTRHLPTGVARGIGVDENTAVVVTHPDTTGAVAKIIGEAGVTFFDLTSSFVDPSETFFSIRDVSLTYLTHGDVINLHTHRVTFAPDKTPLKGHELFDHALNSHDVFHGKDQNSTRKPEFVRVAASIFDSRYDASSYGVTLEQHPQFRVEMWENEAQGGEGYVKRMGGFHSDLHSYKDMYVAIHV